MGYSDWDVVLHPELLGAVSSKCLGTYWTLLLLTVPFGVPVGGLWMTHKYTCVLAETLAERLGICGES